MVKKMNEVYKPLVSAATRTGLTLLVVITRNFTAHVQNNRIEPRIIVLHMLANILGRYVYRELENSFHSFGIEKKLLYNEMFHTLAGGTKWLKEDDNESICVRKYIGAKGMGDFTLLVSYPRELLETEWVVHSHMDPTCWFRDSYYDDHTKFASIRHPAGAINSAMFSINALTSEYIQKYLKGEQDNDDIRQDIAKYKLTNLDFFKSVQKYYSKYLDDFMAVRDRFILMKWEDLIQTPVPTILNLADKAGISIKPEDASNIWNNMDHVNLNGPHKHNFRRGKGKVNDWKNWLVNEHIEILKEFEVEPVLQELGYGPLEYLNSKYYTPFQQEISEYIHNNRIYEDFNDSELFGFSVQKSNVDWRDLEGFRGYDWREYTKLERSCFSDENIEKSVWDNMENAAAKVNAILHEYLTLTADNGVDIADAARTVIDKYSPEWGWKDYGYYAWNFRKLRNRLAYYCK